MAAPPAPTTLRRRHPAPPAARRRGRLVQRALILVDVVGLSLAFLVAQLLFGGGTAAVDRLGVGLETLVFIGTLPGWLLIAKLYGLYDRDEERMDHSTADELVGVLQVVTLGAWVFVAGAWLTGAVRPDMPKLIGFWTFSIVFMTGGRAVTRAVCRSRPSYRQNTLIVGAGEIGQRIARRFLRHPELGINLLGFVDADPKERVGAVEAVPVLGATEDVLGIAKERDVERVVIAFSNDPPERMLAMIRSLRSLDVQVDVVPRLFEMVGSNAAPHTVCGLPFIGLPPLRLSRSKVVVKRTLDVVVALTSLVFLAPVFALAAVAIKVDSPGSVFFRQVRVGAGARSFEILKFRTMVTDAEVRKHEISHLNEHRLVGDGRMFKVRDDPRVTRVGRFLRRYALDELPQLVNVLRGEMSLVGPRPLILDEDQHVGAWARRRLELRPGMTGLWQVMGRSEIPFDEMVSLDFLYVTTWSFANDCRLIARTIPIMLRGKSY